MQINRLLAAARAACSVIVAAAALTLGKAGTAGAQQAYIEQPSGTYTEAGSAYPTTPEGMAVPGLYSQQDLDRLLAPIALYPDALLSQVLMAATHPRDVAEAARWAREHPGWSGQAAIDAVSGHDWDASVTSLLNVPQVLALLDQRPDWMRSLAHAFLNQEPHVLETVQALRRRAQAAGTLTPDMELSQWGNDILIGGADPQWIALPWYDPLLVYGRWWWPLAPVRWTAWPGLPRTASSAVYLPGHRVPFARRLFQPTSTGFHVSAPQLIHLPYGRFDWQQRRLQVVHTHFIGNQPAYLSLAPWRRATTTVVGSRSRQYVNVPAQSPAATMTGSRPAPTTGAIMAAPLAVPSPTPGAIANPAVGHRIHATPVRPERPAEPPRHLAPVRDQASQQINGHLGSGWTHQEGGQMRDGAAMIINPRPGDGIPGAHATPLALPARPGLMAAPVSPVVRTEPSPPARHHHGHATATPPASAPTATPQAPPSSAPPRGHGQGQGQRRSLMR